MRKFAWFLLENQASNTEKNIQYNNKHSVRCSLSCVHGTHVFTFIYIQEYLNWRQTFSMRRAGFLYLIRNCWPVLFGCDCSNRANLFSSSQAHCCLLYFCHESSSGPLRASWNSWFLVSPQLKRKLIAFRMTENILEWRFTRRKSETSELNLRNPKIPTTNTSQHFGATLSWVYL